MKKKLLLSGNEAVALGAYEAGITVAAGYPGTPSSEILQEFKDYPGNYTEWSVNEKVALEVGLGAAYSGARTLVTMKHVGVNVAADPLFTASYTGINGALVILTADEPGMHSSQNEQDSRNYALAAKLPMLEPADSAEARDFVKEAVSISEEFDTPVFLRSTTRLSHSKSILEKGNPPRKKKISGFKPDSRKFVMIPAYARPRHEIVEERMRRIAEFAETSPLNRIEKGKGSIGFITAGNVYTYVKEAFPEAHILKLGMVWPLPLKMIKRFISSVEKVYIVEELDPFFERFIKSEGLKAEGKKFFPITGEFSPDTVINGVKRRKKDKTLPSLPFNLPPRPPAFCPGCPHSQVFQVLRDNKFTVSGDIGCYTLSALPPYNAMDTCVDMGASVTVSQGMEIAMGDDAKVVSVIGDSTFAHSGITGLLNAAYNGRSSLVIVLDNSTTAMTGMQPNPLSGERIDGSPALRLDYKLLAASMGIKKDNFSQVNAYKKDEIEKEIIRLSQTPSLSLLVVKGDCVIFKKRNLRRKK